MPSIFNSSRRVDDALFDLLRQNAIEELRAGLAETVEMVHGLGQDPAKEPAREALARVGGGWSVSLDHATQTMLFGLWFEASSRGKKAAAQVVSEAIVGHWQGFKGRLESPQGDWAKGAAAGGLARGFAGHAQIEPPLIEAAHRMGQGESRLANLGLRALLAAGADPREADSQSGKTPLMLACAYFNAEAVQALLPGSDPNQRDRRGRATLRCLVDALAQQSAPNPREEEAVSRIAEALLPISDISLRDDQGANVLHAMAGRGFVDLLVQALEFADEESVMASAEGKESVWEQARRHARDDIAQEPWEALSRWKAQREANQLRAAIGETAPGQEERQEAPDANRSLRARRV